MERRGPTCQGCVEAIAAIAGFAFSLLSSVAFASGFSLAFNATGSSDVDRVKIRVDDPANALPGGPVDVGATDFTIEFWIKAASADNTAAAVTCGANTAWINGNIVVDRDRFNQDRKFGVSIAGGVVVFGVSGQGPGDRTICGTASVLDNAWHHVAVQRRVSDGFMWLYVDGTLQASADGPDGDVSYPDNGVPGNFCGGPCTNSDPFLVLGAEKHDAGPAFPSYRGLFDELRISSVLRYATNFSAPACAVPRRRFDRRALPLRRRHGRARERHRRQRGRTRARRHPARDADRRAAVVDRHAIRLRRRSRSMRRYDARDRERPLANPVDIVCSTRRHHAPVRRRAGRTDPHHP